MHEGPVLVVDDDIDIREAIRDALEQEGHSVALAADGQEALDYLGRGSIPSLILLDWNMAPMNAEEFMEAFSKHALSGQVPVVLVTADARANEKMSHGFAGILRKPMKLEALYDVVRRYRRK